MAKQPQDKEKFRPDTSAIDRELDNALGGLSLDELYASKEQDNAEHQKPQHGAKGPRRGRIISVNKDDVMVDFGGKSQGVAPMESFETEPKVGDEMEFEVERYDPSEGLLILAAKGRRRRM